MAPPITPSPHRFVLKKEHLQPKLSGSQFNTTPRFSLSSNSQTKSTQEHPRPSQFLLNYQTPITKRSKEQAAIEIESDDSSSTEEKELDNSDIRFKTKDHGNIDDIEEPLAKKRRQSTSPEPLDCSPESVDGVEMLTDDPDNQVSPSPLTNPFCSVPLKGPASTKATRFLISSSDLRPNSRVLSESSIFVKPPQFRPRVSPSSPSLQSDPDPNQFSPSRKGEKYIHGGLADELRNWLVNIKSSVLAIHSMNCKPWLMKVLIEEFVEEGKGRMTLIRGKRLQSSEEETINTLSEVRVILAGQASSTGLQKSCPIQNGGIVGIKGPVWEVPIKGEVWSVGVDWQLI